MSEQQIASRWPSLPGQQSFIDLMRAFEAYARPFRPMWPFFWLKAAAVKLDDTWHLVVFSLSGQWSDDRRAAPVEPPLEALALISKRLDAASAWQMVESLVATKTVEIAQGIVAAVPDVFISPSGKWQEAYPYTSVLATDVADQATWWYLNLGDQRQWLDSAQRSQVDAAIRPTLEYLSEDSFESFIAARFARQRPQRGGFPSIDNFNYHLDLPLALRVTVSAYTPGDAERRIEVDCHAPLQFSELAITQGDIQTPAAQAVTLEEDASSEGGWTIGHASIAATTSKLRIASPQLRRILSYEFSVPTIPELVADAVARLYAPHDPAGKGAEKWARDLLTGTGPAFEVALLNALVRLGIPVLFSGQFTTPEGQTGGTATPGIDLVALDCRGKVVLPWGCPFEGLARTARGPI